MSIDDLRISIKELKSETKEMMELCEVAIEKSVDSIVNKDLELAREVIKMDDDIDNLRNKIIEKSKRFLFKTGLITVARHLNKGKKVEVVENK